MMSNTKLIDALKSTIEERDEAYNEIIRLKNYISTTEKKPSIWEVKQTDSLSEKVDKIMKESDEALLRFNKKLRKENAKYAKQKQSKR